MLKRIWNTYANFGLPVKLLVGSLIGIVAGPGLIGFLSEYATYTYALRLGIRPPLEGIPYLKTSVTAFSLVATVIVALIFIITRSLASFVAEHLARQLGELANTINSATSPINTFTGKLVSIPIFDHNILLGKLKSFTPKVAIPLTLLVSIFIGGVMLIVLTINDNPDALSISCGIAIYIFVALMTTWSKKSIWWVSGAFAVGFYITSFVILFNVPYYSSFLRAVGYGGGTNVQVYYKESSQTLEGNYYLLLRTTEALICMGSNAKMIIEIPLGNVQKITYQLGSNFDKSKYRLPDMRSSM